MPTPRRTYHKIIRPSPKVEKFLGELEAEVMEILWAEREFTVREVRERLRRPLAYTTVMTVMGRLVEKGLLRRVRDGGSYRYRAATSRDEFLRATSQRIIDELMADLGEVAIAQLVSTLQGLDPERLAELARLAGEEGTEQRRGEEP